MTSRMFRLPAPWGARINRTRPVNFTFDGKPVQGFAGDTVSSAVFAAADQPDYLARSFKYHRPRSVLLGRGLDANQYVTIDGVPNLSADNRTIEDGLLVEPQNVFGSLKHDKGAALGLFTKFLPPGFYYDAFYKPKGSWPFWESIIRRFAGLGVLDPKRQKTPPSEKQNLFCEVAVIGGGVAGMFAALTAADAGCEVVLVEREPCLGGMSANARLTKAERLHLEELTRAVAAHKSITVLYETTCAGWFEGNVLTAHGKGVYYHIRAAQVVAAAGVVEQPLVFRNNDVPGVMLASTVGLLMRGYGVCPGKRVVVQTANRFGYETALTLLEAGCEVPLIIEMRAEAPDDAVVAECRARGVKIVSQSTATEAAAGRDGRLKSIGYRRIAGDGLVLGDTHSIACDTFVTSVAFSPLMQLVCHSGGEVVYDTELASLRVAKTPVNGTICGSLNGRFGFEAAARDGERAGRAAARAAGANVFEAGGPATVAEQVNFPWTVFPHPKGKDFVDFDEDQTVSDIHGALAAGFDHMELMKRYTTVGMGPSQGRTTALNALKVFAKASGRDLSKVRITTQRPPFEPEPFANLAAECETPTRQTVLHQWHLANGAMMMPAGSWARPAYYGAAENVNAEALAVRNDVGLQDASTHGGFHLAGPDCDKLLAVAYINDFGAFGVGETRFAWMVDELGSIVDDCVACRLAEHELYLVTSSGASAATGRKLRKLVVEHGLDVAITDLSGGMAILNLAGPKARSVLQTMACDIDCSPAAFPHHAFRRGSIDGIPVTLIRGDFVGETTFECHVGASYAVALWEKLIAAGKPFGIRPFGLLAQRILRLEKAHVIIGQDTDHATTPDDINGAAKVALHKPYFVGKSAIEILRSKSQRKYLRPFEVVGASRADAPDEYSLVESNGAVVGRITSAEYSPKLGKVVGLILIESGEPPVGNVRVWSQTGGGKVLTLLERAPYDPDNERQAG